MVDKRLVDYVRQQINAGYDINSIRAHLLRYGYDASAVDAAVKKAARKGFPLGIAAGIIGLLLIIVVVTLVIINMGPSAPEQLLDLEIAMISEDIYPRDTIEFNVQSISMGNTKRYDITLLHEIRDSSGRMITSKEEDVGIETRISKVSRIKVPVSASAGRYNLRTTAFYDSRSASSQVQFDIQETVVEPEPGPEPEKRCPASCDDNDPCTEDICNAETDYECEHNPIVPCCGNNICEKEESYETCSIDCPFEGPDVPEPTPDPPEPTEKPGDYYVTGSEYSLGEVIEIAQQKSSPDPKNAVRFCNDFTGNYKDICLTTVAKQTNNYRYCEDIVFDAERDNCYTHFIVENEDYTLCSKVVNKHIRTACESMAAYE